MDKIAVSRRHDRLSGDHLPLYRQEEMYDREGVGLDRSTLADGVGGASGLLQPLLEALRRHMMAAQKLHADDTPVPVRAPGLGKMKLGRLWTHVRADWPAGDPTHPAAWFAYTSDRKSDATFAYCTYMRNRLELRRKGVMQPELWSGS